MSRSIPVILLFLLFSLVFPTAHGALPPSDRDVFVCITGQLSRLELRNKIEKLFLPLHNMGYKVRVGLALSTDNTTRFTNHDNGDMMQLYTSIPQVREALKSKVTGIKHFDKVNQMKTPEINNIYLLSLTIKPGVNNTERAINHAKQYKTLQYCNHWPKMSENALFFIRIREDTLIDHIDLKSIIKLARGGAVVTTACDSWRGINDKMAFGPSSRSTDFFRLPFLQYTSMTCLIPGLTNTLSSEPFYKQVYGENGFNLVASNDFVVTKAIAVAAKQSKIGDSDKRYCSITGNPFQAYSKQCPPNGVSSDIAYEQECWDMSAAKAMHVLE